MKKSRAGKAFSDELAGWLRGKQPRTLASLEAVFGDRTFAIIFLLLMILPATPLPTGGITHVFEVIVLLLCLELIAGFQAPWLPKRWKHMHLGKTFTGKVVPVILKWIRRCEKASSPRGRWIFHLPLAQRLLGLLIFCLTLAALLSPPFSGLDTLPSLGVVLISLAIILEDVVLLLAGTMVGAAGVGLTIALGTAIVQTGRHFF
ncbi:MAG TPA: exopolysaccharide biosynthesis protein [Candidatus Saccharimonadales bacterium]|nr:exopolysaccharide biosynthesis protein [Candidatus Saccharimonadales bacterium]